MHYIVCVLRPQALATTQEGGYTFREKLASDCLKQYFTDRALAELYATNMASTHPMVQFAVFDIMQVLETLKPTVVRKKITEGGELVLDKGESDGL